MGYITDISDATTYTVLETVPGSTIQSSSASYDLANRIPDGARVAFSWSYSSSYYTCGIDDVCVGVLSSSTPKPTGLTVSDITATSATLTWEAPANATPMSYLYHYKKASDSYYDQPIDNGQNLSVTLNGLDANAEYNFGVYANYADGSSDYAEITFTTEASCLPPTDITVSDITSTGAKLAWTPGGNETSWQYITVAHGDTPDWTSGTVMTSYTHTNVPANIHYCTGVEPQPNTEYDFYVRADCGGGDYSEAAMLTFRTACGAVTTFPWSENFESYAAGDFSDPCWVNEHISGNGTSVFKVYTYSNGTNSTHQLQLPDMNSGTMTKLVLPEMTIPANTSFEFGIDVYRNSSSSSYAEEGIRVYASTDGEIEGATELAFISRNYTVSDNNLIPAESASGWYTYKLPWYGLCSHSVYRNC